MNKNYVFTGKGRVFLKFVKYAITVLLPVIAFLISYIALNVTITGTTALLKPFLIAFSLVLIVVAFLIRFMANDLLKLTFDERVEVDGKELTSVNNT